MTDLTQNANQQTQPSDTSSQTSQASQTTTETTPSSDEGDLTSEIGTSDDGDLTSDAPVKEGEATEAPADPYADFRGPPENGEYADYTLPDGAVADQELKAEFDPLVKELGLSQKGAQRLVEFKSKLDQRQLQQWNDYQNSLTVAAKRDPEIGGLKYQDTMSAGRQVVSKFGNDAFKAMLRDTGVARHPEMIRFLAKVAKATGETPALGEGGGAVSEPKPLYELMYGPAKKE